MSTELPVGTQLADQKTARFGLAVIGVLLIAANLRVSFVTVGPLLNDIGGDLRLSSAAAGLLTGLPLIAFAVISPVAPAAAFRLGLDRTLWASLLLLASGIVFRSVPVAGFLWGGTAIIGIAIAFLNVLLPSLVKRDFPTRVSQVTGNYSAVRAASAALGVAVVVPIAQTSPMGWRLALGIWAGLALITMAVLLPTLRRHQTKLREPDQHQMAHLSPWKTVLGWQVTVFMGLQSIAYYVFTTWLPSIEHSRGVSATTAGMHLSVFLMVSVAASLSTGSLLHRFADQRAIALVSSLLALSAYGGLAVAPGLTLIWVICGALGCGSLIVIALSLFSLRTRHHSEAAALSGMAQSVGYALGAAGPVAFGALHDLSNGWTLPLLVTTGIMAFLCFVAMLAARDQFIGGMTARTIGAKDREPLPRTRR